MCEAELCLSHPHAPISHPHPPIPCCPTLFSPPPHTHTHTLLPPHSCPCSPPKTQSPRTLPVSCLRPIHLRCQTATLPVCTCPGTCRNASSTLNPISVRIPPVYIHPPPLNHSCTRIPPPTPPRNFNPPSPFKGNFTPPPFPPSQTTPLTPHTPCVPTALPPAVQFDPDR